MFLCIIVLLSLITAFVFIHIARKKQWQCFSFLYESETPLIIAIILSVASLFVGPYLNQRFEEQRIRSEYVLDNLKNLKLDTLQLFNDIQRLNNDKLNPTYAQIENDGLRLRYRILEIESILGKNQFIDEFQVSLTTVLNNLHDKPEKRYIYVNRFIIASRNLSIFLAKNANIAAKDIKFYRLDKVDENKI